MAAPGRLCLVVFAVAFVCLAASASSPAAAAEFRVTDLGTDPQLVAISDSGQVAGISLFKDSRGVPRQHAFSWTPADGIIDLGADAGYDSRATAINNRGVVVGWGHFEGSDQGFAWTKAGGMTLLGTLPGETEPLIPTAVNDSGQIVGRQGDRGFSWTPTGGLVDVGRLGEGGWTAAEAVNGSGQVVGGSDGKPFIWTQDGGMADLGALPGASGGDAHAVNSNGQVVGHSGSHAFSWTPGGGMVDLGALPSSHPSSDATAVNDNGQVVGSSSVGDDIYPSQPGSTTGSNAFSWTAAGGMVDVSPVSGEYGGAYAVNDKGQVVGTDWGNHNAFSSGFSWTATGGRIRLAPFSGGVSSGAVDINSAGQIAGWADADYGNPHAVIWSPADLATGGDDTLTGTSGPNLICGLGGDDTINGLRGNDTLFGDACGAKARALAAAAGKGGNDTLNGGKGNDKLYGADGNDTMNGRDGNDKLYGGRGSDKLNGGPGVNSYSGGPGNDKINARNGKKETVDCGPGNKDVAVVDQQDKTKACEKVERVKR